MVNIPPETRSLMIEEAHQVLMATGWPDAKERPMPTLSDNWTGTTVGVLTPGKGKKWNTSHNVQARQLVSFVVQQRVDNIGGGTGMPSIARSGEVLKKLYGKGKDITSKSAMKEHIGILLDAVAFPADDDDAPPSDDDLPSDDDATKIAPAPSPTVVVKTIVSDAVMVDAIPEQSVDANTWVMMERTNTDSVQDALNATNFKSSKATSKEKNGWASCQNGKIHQENENHGAFANGTLGSYAFGKGKNGDFQFGRILMLFSDDLFSAIGVKPFALNLLRDTYDCFEDMCALVHSVGSMDARKHISHDVKLAFLTKHIKYDDAWDESSILALDGKRATPTGSLTASQERSKDFFSGLF